MPPESNDVIGFIFDRCELSYVKQGLWYIVIDIRVNRDTRTSCLCISTGSNDHHFSDPLNKRQRPRWQDYSTCRRTEIRGVRLPLLSNHRRPYFSVTKHCSNQIIIILLFWGFISSAISYCLVFSLTDACSYFIFLSTCCCSQLNLLRIFRVVYKYTGVSYYSGCIYLMYIADQACELAVYKQFDMGCSSSHIPHQKMINYREESENETSTTWDCRGEPDGEVCSNTSKFIGPEVKYFNQCFEPDRCLKPIIQEFVRDS